MAGFGKQPAAAKSGSKFEGKKTFKKHMKLFGKLQNPADRSNQVDCYVREDGNEKFWFVGKSVAKAGCCNDAALSMVAQKRMIFEHSQLLVRELQLAKGSLQLWAAPANTEMKVAQKMMGLRRVDQLPRPETLATGDCGFEPEQWTDPKLGFYTRLGDDGQPKSGPTPAKIVGADQLAEGVESMKRDLELDSDAKVEVSLDGKAVKAKEPKSSAPAPASASEPVVAEAQPDAAPASPPPSAPDGFDWGGTYDQ